MKRALSAILILISIFSLTACQKTEEAEADNNSELVLGKTGELTYFISETFRPPSGAGFVEQYCISGDNLYAVCISGSESQRKKLPESSTLWKRAGDKPFEKLDGICNGYFMEALCGDDEKICLLLHREGEYSFCVIENDVSVRPVSLKLDDEGFGDFFISLYDGKLLVWKLEGYMQLFDIESGDRIKKVKLGNPDNRFIQMCATSDSMYAVFYNTSAGPGYVDLEDLINGSELSPIPMGCISTSNQMGNSISCDESILFADATAFNSISVETGAKTRLFVFSEAGIGNSVYPMVLPIKTADGSIYIRDDSFNIARLEPRLVPKKETLVYMSNFSGGGINMILNKFNKTNDKYKIEHVVFDASNAEKLIAEILAGKAPDILDVSFINKIISNKQIFADLMPHIESDEKIKADDLYMNILNGFKSDEQLYAFPSSFHINAIAVPYTGNFLIKNPGFEEFEEILEKAGAAKEGKHIGPKAFFELALPVIEKDILIGEQGARRIDKEALIKWLELSEKIPKYRVSRLEINNLSSFSSDRKFLGEFTIVGFPGKNISGAYAKTRFVPFLSIMKNTKSEEAAWEFVREYLVSEYDPLSFSLNRKIAEKNTDEYLRLAKVHKENVAEEDAENLKELLRSINIAENPDTSLRNIILEEAEAYFSGQRNIEKTVELIENRANILISEKGL